MDSIKIRQSLIDHTGLWMSLWIILALDIIVIWGLTFSFNLFLLIAFIIISMAGIAVIKTMSERPLETAVSAPVLNREMVHNLDQLMKEIRPVCEDIFAREIDNITLPVMENMRADFTLARGWLWEGGEAFLQRVQQSMFEMRHIVQLVSSLSGDSPKIIQRLKYDMEVLVRAAGDIHKQNSKDHQELDRFLANKVNGLKQSMDREKDIFYDYVQKMLIEHIQEEEAGIETLELFNVSRLGEQFSNVVEKSVQARLDYFEKSVLYDLEQLAADIVGKIQKGTLDLMTTLKEMEELMNNLLNEAKNESSMTINKLAESRDKVKALKEESNDIMLTLAWSDILTQKRWLAMEEKLAIIREKVHNNLDEEFQKYVAGRLDEDMPDYYNLSSNSATASIYKSLLDAEFVYHAMRSGHLDEYKNEGVYVLLEYIRPVETMAAYVVSFPEEASEQRRGLKERARKNEFQDVFNRVNHEMNSQCPELLSFIDGVFPQNFTAFCNNPHVGSKPQDAGQAGWMVFMRLIENPGLPPEFYLLAGLLLYVQQMRKNYIHPLKSRPLPLNSAVEIEDMRNAAFRTVKILMLYDTYKHKFQ